MSNLLAKENNLKLRNLDDAMDILASGLPGCIFTLDDLSNDFFHLSNRVAGEVFQKFVNYNFKAAFILPSNHALGERVTELARDHARHNCIRFFETIEQADMWLINN